MTVILRIALILGVADHVAADTARRGADRGPFKPASGLMPDNAANGSAAEGTENSPGLGIRSSGAGDERGAAEKC